MRRAHAPRAASETRAANARARAHARVRTARRSWRKVIAQLSFMDPMSEDFPDDPLRKMRQLDTDLQKKCDSAWNALQHIALDEAMIRCLSKRCPILRYLPRKPIKWGIKAFVYADAAGYVKAWKFDVGGSANAAGNVLIALLTGFFVVAYWHKGYVLFADSWFVTIPVVLWLRARGIHIVGPHKWKRPATAPTDGRLTWPWFDLPNSVVSALARGWRRTARVPLDESGSGASTQRRGRGTWWLYATQWRDAKPFCLLYTTYQNDAEETFARRYDKASRSYKYYTSFLAQKAYARRMGPVDRFDKDQARMNIRVNRVGRRWQRAAFYWDLGLIVHDARIVFEFVLPSYEKFLREPGIPYSTYWQLSLGRELMNHGIQRYCAEYMQGRGDETPHFMRKKSGAGTARCARECTPSRNASPPTTHRRAAVPTVLPHHARDERRSRPRLANRAAPPTQVLPDEG